MLDPLLEFAIPYGIFAALFIWLLNTTNTRNELREDSYQKTIRKNQEIIAELAKSFTNLSGDVKEIKEALKRGGVET
ncbi:MAG: BhlA/UviB family holin-like peptide [Defluviitaleaceae bacterium]|nr:BhlA/UviB family holin-like peptide [Defluviitaleaceae bacterium]